MANTLTMTYASSITNICELNSSFDIGVLKVCYVGDNRNGSSISKDVLMSCAKTMFNVPVVCHYNRESNSLGGHDMEVFKDNTGNLRLVNLTQPVGVVPESAEYWFATAEDENGVEHEYLFTQVILWKRQEAYRKIKEDGIVSHSMEISISESKKIDGVLHIKDFEFTAFALIGVEPCYESSALEVFALEDFKKQMAEMMQDLKETYTKVSTSQEVDDKEHTEFSKEGGNETMDKKQELIEKYGIDVNSLDFSIEDLTEEELIAKFESLTKTEDNEGDVNTAEQEETFAEEQESESENEVKEEDDEGTFALSTGLLDEASRVLASMETLTRPYGEIPRYRLVDMDLELSEIYGFDSEDWLLYGFSYSMNGDNIVIDAASKKRMKYAIVPFDQGEQASPVADVVASFEANLAEFAQTKEDLIQANAQIETLNAELDTLRQFKHDVEAEKLNVEVEEVFSQFSDLEELEVFQNLKDNHDGMTVEAIRKECFAIRGEFGTPQQVNFNLNKNQSKFKVPTHEDSYEPYGGLFVKYGTNK